MSILSKFTLPVALLNTVSGIVINDAIGLAGSEAYAAQFDAVVGIGYYDQNNDAVIYGTGVLIDEYTILTASHNKVNSLGQDYIFFGTDASAPTAVFAADTFIDDFSTGNSVYGDGTDLALVKLSTAITSVDPMSLTYDFSTVLGMEATVTGYGFSGIGSEGTSNFDNTIRYAGTNVIDDYLSEDNGYRWVLDFDNGSETYNSLGSATPTTYEASIASGDSGGPLLVQNGDGEWVVAGITNAGFTPDGSDDAGYGEVTLFTGLAPAASWLDYYTNANVVSISTVPEPSSLAFLASGVGLLALRRRR